MDTKSAIAILKLVKARFDSNERYQGFICIELLICVELLDFDDRETVECLRSSINRQLAGCNTLEAFIKYEYTGEEPAIEKACEIRKAWLSAMITSLETDGVITADLLRKTLETLHYV